MELADELGLPAREARLTPADLETADEAFITGTTREVTPVVAVDDRPIGAGTPGPISQQLLDALRERADALDPPAIADLSARPPNQFLRTRVL